VGDSAPADEWSANGRGSNLLFPTGPPQPLAPAGTAVFKGLAQTWRQHEHSHTCDDQQRLLVLANAELAAGNAQAAVVDGQRPLAQRAGSRKENLIAAVERQVPGVQVRMAGQRRRCGARCEPGSTRRGWTATQDQEPMR